MRQTVWREFTFWNEARDNGWASGCKQLSWQKAAIVGDSGAPCRFPPNTHIPCASRAVVSLPAAKAHGLISAHMNSQHNRLKLKVFELLFSFLCAPRCPFCAVFVSPQCNAHLSRYSTVRSRKSHIRQHVQHKHTLLWNPLCSSS